MEGVVNILEDLATQSVCWKQSPEPSCRWLRKNAMHQQPFLRKQILPNKNAETWRSELKWGGVPCGASSAPMSFAASITPQRATTIGLLMIFAFLKWGFLQLWINLHFVASAFGGSLQEMWLVFWLTTSSASSTNHQVTCEAALSRPFSFFWWSVKHQCLWCRKPKVMLGCWGLFLETRKKSWSIALFPHLENQLTPETAEEKGGSFWTFCCKSFQLWHTALSSPLWHKCCLAWVVKEFLWCSPRMNDSLHVWCWMFLFIFPVQKKCVIWKPLSTCNVEAFVNRWKIFTWRTSQWWCIPSCSFNSWFLLSFQFWQQVDCASLLTVTIVAFFKMQCNNKQNAKHHGVV